MKKITLIFLISITAILLNSDFSYGEPISAQARKAGHIPGEIIVSLREDVHSLPQVVLSVCNKYGKIKGEPKYLGFGIYKIKFKDKQINLKPIIREVKTLSEVENVSLNFLMKSKNRRVLPNDYNPDILKGLEMIRAPEGWNITVGSKNVKVAIIDSGVDLDHSDLKDNLIDEGYDFVDNDDVPEDNYGHGTAISGIIGAVGDNNKGIVGVNWEVSLINLKALDAPDGTGTVADIIRALEYATKEKVDVINMSFAPTMNLAPSQRQLFKKAIQGAYSEEIVLIAAAGNSNTDDPQYPAAFDEVIAVSGVDQNGKKLDVSNYGDYIDVAAPGERIFTTDLNDSYKRWTGTSMSAAFVSGLAALILSENPYFSPPEVKNKIKNNVDPIDSPEDKPIGSGIINIFKALGGEENSQDGVKAVASVGEIGNKSIEVVVDEEIQFFSEGSTAPEGEELQYLWNFGDETPTSQEENPTHVYEKEGNYTSTLMVWTEASHPDEDTVTVTVGKSEGLVELIAEPIEGIAPLEVEFKANIKVNKPVKEISWDFGDEKLSSNYRIKSLTNETVASHTYKSPGTYTANVTVTFEDDTEAGDNIQIIVKPKQEDEDNLKAIIHANPTSGKPPLKVLFSGDDSDSPNNHIVRYSWNFGDGSPTHSGKHLVKIAHIYSEEGEYEATLTVTDNNGASDNDSVTIKVEDSSDNGNDDNEEGEAIVYGKVTDESDNPIQGAKVTATRIWLNRIQYMERDRDDNDDIPERIILPPKPSWPVVAKDITDENGEYRLEIPVTEPPCPECPIIQDENFLKPKIWPLPYSNNFRITVTKSGCHPETETVTLEPEETKELNFILKKTTTPSKKAIVFGEVKDSTGNPIQGAVVKAIGDWLQPMHSMRKYFNDNNNGNFNLPERLTSPRLSWPGIIKDTTDENGEYKLEIPINDYDYPPYLPIIQRNEFIKPEIYPPPYPDNHFTVTVTKSGYIPKSKTVTLEAGQEKEVNFFLTNY